MKTTRKLEACTGIAWLIALCTSGAAFAGAQVLPLGEPDKHGAITYSVKCESGVSKIVQCVRDDRHCGYAGELTLAASVEQACGTSAPASEVPSTFETAPASP